MGRFGRPALRAAIMMALGVCVALAAANNSHRGIADQDAWAMDETTGSSPRDKHASVELALSDEQRGRIYEGRDGHRGCAGCAGAGAHGGRCASRRSADAG